MTNFRDMWLAERGAQSASSSAITTLEKRVIVQQAALDDALADLSAARARLPVETPDLPDLGGAPRLSADQIRQTAEFDSYGAATGVRRRADPLHAASSARRAALNAAGQSRGRVVHPRR